MLFSLSHCLAFQLDSHCKWHCFGVGCEVGLKGKRFPVESHLTQHLSLERPPSPQGPVVSPLSSARCLCPRGLAWAFCSVPYPSPGSHWPTARASWQVWSAVRGAPQLFFRWSWRLLALCVLVPPLPPPLRGDPPGSERQAASLPPSPYSAAPCPLTLAVMLRFPPAPLGTQ